MAKNKFESSRDPKPGLPTYNTNMAMDNLYSESIKITGYDLRYEDRSPVCAPRSGLQSFLRNPLTQKVSLRIKAHIGLGTNPVAFASSVPSNDEAAS